MLIINVKALADNICLGSGSDAYSRATVLETVIALTVRKYNNDMSDSEVTEVLDELNRLNQYMLVDLMFADVYKDITAHFNKLGYDRRLHLRYVPKVVKGIMHKVIITMDLDSTLEYYKEYTPKAKVKLANVVEENPSLELINAFVLQPQWSTRWVKN